MKCHRYCEAAYVNQADPMDTQSRSPGVHTGQIRGAVPLRLRWMPPDGLLLLVLPFPVAVSMLFNGYSHV